MLCTNKNKVAWPQGIAQKRLSVELWLTLQALDLQKNNGSVLFLITDMNVFHLCFEWIQSHVGYYGHKIYIHYNTYCSLLLSE